MVMDHEICILNGDLNYRIDTMGRDTVVNAVKANNLGKLLERDQLLASKRKNPWFRLRAFEDSPLHLLPLTSMTLGQIIMIPVKRNDLQHGATVYYTEEVTG